MSKRIKVVAAAVKTREAMESVVGEICKLTIEHDSTTAEMDGRIQNIRSEYEPRLAEIQIELDAQMALARDWAEANPLEFVNAKSIEMVHGRIGWRTGMPKLKTVAGYTWEKVKMILLNSFPGYTREEVSIDKEKILSERESLGDGQLKRMGVRVTQDEAFFVDPKREDLADKRQTA